MGQRHHNVSAVLDKVHQHVIDRNKWWNESKRETTHLNIYVSLPTLSSTERLMDHDP